MPFTQQVAVVILNWNGIHFLQQFLPYVELHSPGAEIIVADNASTDGSVLWLKRNHKEIRIIQLDKNKGFAGGYNAALKEVKADIYILLNSDVEVTEGWMVPVLQLMQDDPSVAACQPKIRSFANRNFIEHAGGVGGFIDYLGYPFCRGRIYMTVEEDKGQYDNKMEVFWATGACLFIRSEIFHQCEGFDEDFFAHMEEIDLCWRIKQSGYRIMVEPASVVYHVGGGTLPKSNPVKTYYNFRNNLLMLHKNLPAGQWKAVFMVRLLLDGLAGIKFLVDGHVKDCLSIIKAHIYFYKNYSRRKRMRMKAVAEVKTSKVSCIYQKSIVFAYYILRKKHFSDLENDFSK